MSNIVLTGLSGSGKTTLAGLLAEALGMRCIDTDREIERGAGMPITELFARYGEAHFRDLETQAVAEAARDQHAVIATGGGAVLRPENVQYLRATGQIVFLDRPVDSIVQDLACDGRPLLKNGAEKLYGMEAERRHLYESTADIIFRNTGTLEEAMAGLLALLRADRAFAAVRDSHSRRTAV